VKFKKYDSIENSYRDKVVKSIQINFPNERFFVQEKIHGANFSVWTDGETIRFAKRSGFIGGEENFYNYDTIADDLSNKIKSLFQTATNSMAYNGCKEITIYGELYGGNYPHPDVQITQMKAVQKGIYYRPDVSFLAFDMLIDGELIDYSTFAMYSTFFEIPFLPALFVGTLSECLSFNNEYQTTIPTSLGLPELENNICEGNVIKPLKPLFFGNGTRVILKNKNSKFTEKSTKTFTPPPEASPEVVQFQKAAVEYITDNRLRNVISKLGEVTTKDFGKLLGLLSKDVFEDFEKDFPEYRNLESKDRKFVTRLVNNECGNLIRPNFANIIDGNF